MFTVVDYSQSYLLLLTVLALFVASILSFDTKRMKLSTAASTIKTNGSTRTLVSLETERKEDTKDPHVVETEGDDKENELEIENGGEGEGVEEEGREELSVIRTTWSEMDTFGVIVGFPDDLKVLLLSFMDAPSISRMARLNHGWKELTERSTLWQLICQREFRVALLPAQFATWKDVYYDHSIPLEKDPKFLLCCYGYLGEHSAVGKLKEQPMGTFLFRSSSTDASAITISFVHRDGSVKHRRMYKVTDPIPGFTFQLPGYKQGAVEVNVYYKNYYHLLQNNSDWMKFPLVSLQSEEAKSLYYQKTKIDVYCRDKEGPPSSAHIHFIAQSIRGNLTVATELCVRANVYYGFRIGDDDLVTLVQALEENKTVSTLSISHMHLNETVCDAIGKLLSVSKTLSKLVFHHCSCDASSTLPIQKALSTSSLKSLVLNNRTWLPKTVKSVSEKDFTNFQCLPWECAKQ